MKIIITTIKKYKKKRDQTGAVAVITAIATVVLIGFAALAIDIGYLYSTRNELQNVADAAALAGAGYLGKQYKIYQEQSPPVFPSGVTFTLEEIHDAVEEVATKNQAAKKSISINIEDIKVGMWDPDNPSDILDANETLTGPDAVRVIARRDTQSSAGPISTFFAKIFGIDVLQSEKMAIAALGGPISAGPGKLNCPIGLSDNMFPDKCGDIVTLSPTDSCAGWHNFLDPINATDLKEKLIGLIEGNNYNDPENNLLNGHDWLELIYNLKKDPVPHEIPEISIGVEFEFQGGDIATAFNGDFLGTDYTGGLSTDIPDSGDYNTVYSKIGKESKKKDSPASIIALFDYFRYRDDDGNDDEWTALVPVYKDDTDGCMNPNTNIEIVGFAEMTIYEVLPPPSKSFKVRLDCNYKVIEAKGGGGSYGNLRGSIPSLVK